MRHQILLLCFLSFGCAGSEFANRFVSKQIEVEYDRFKDITTYKTRPPIESSTGFTTNLQITASFICNGQQMCHPDKIYLSLYSSSQSGSQYNANSELIFIADSVRINLGSLVVASERDRVLSFVYEMMGTDISIAQLDRLANATSVDARLGDNEFKLSYKKREVLRMLYNRLTATDHSVN